jgi:uncharacterized protein
MRIYFDTVAVIYLVERVPPWHSLLVAKLAPHAHHAVISDLTRMECLVKPVRDANTALIAEYQQVFSSSQIVPLTSQVFDRATHIRARHNFKTPDSIHLAAAVESGCDWYLSNDLGLRKFSDIPIITF